MYCISRQLQQKNEVMDLYVCFYYYHKEEDHDFTRYAVISMLYKGVSTNCISCINPYILFAGLPRPTGREEEEERKIWSMISNSRPTRCRNHAARRAELVHCKANTTKATIPSPFAKTTTSAEDHRCLNSINHQPIEYETILFFLLFFFHVEVQLCSDIFYKTILTFSFDLISPFCRPGLVPKCGQGMIIMVSCFCCCRRLQRRPCISYSTCKISL